MTQRVYIGAQPRAYMHAWSKGALVRIGVAGEIVRIVENHGDGWITVEPLMICEPAEPRNWFLYGLIVLTFSAVVLAVVLLVAG